MRHFPPRRIVCLTEETVETLYLLGEQDRTASPATPSDRLTGGLDAILDALWGGRP